MSAEFGKFLAYYANAPEIEKPVSASRKSAEGAQGGRRGKRQTEEGMHRLFINLGKKDGFYPGEMMQFLNKHVHGHVEVGHIDLGNTMSFFDVPEEEVDRVTRFLNGTRYKGREVRCNDGEQDSGARAPRKGQKAAARTTQNFAKPAQRATRKSRQDDGFSDEMGKKGRSARQPMTEGHTFDYSFFDKKKRRGKEMAEPVRESGKRDDWRQFFKGNPVELVGDEPDFTEEGWAMRKPRKKKK